MYKELYPYIVAIIGMIEPNNPKNKPSITKGILIEELEAPTSLIISISVFLEEIVNLIVLDIRKAVTKTKAITVPIDILDIVSKTTISCSTISSP